MALKYTAFTAIIPAYNEAANITPVITEVLQCPHLAELLIVDDGSTDNTAEVLQPFKSDPRFQHIRFERNRGKGAALAAGLKRAKHEIVLFLDADLKNITSAKIFKIVKPVLTDAVDLSRARFQRKRGRVTEIAVKPMMRILFPETSFDQPITGQICGKKSFFETIDLNTNWGVDIGILLDAIDAGQRIQEVDIGQLEHRAHTDEELSVMAHQVLETMIKKAGLIRHKYKVVLFSLDQTIIARDSVQFVLQKLGLDKDLANIRLQLERGEITYPEYLLQIAAHFKNIPIAEVEKACDLIEFEPYTQEVIKALKQRRFEVGIVTPSLSPIVTSVARRLDIKHIECVELKVDAQQKLTGQITPKAKQYWINGGIEQAMVEATRRLTRRINAKLEEVVMVAHTERALPILDRAGLSLAYRPKAKEMKTRADKTITVLAEVLALVE